MKDCLMNLHNFSSVKLKDLQSCDIIALFDSNIAQGYTKYKYSVVDRPAVFFRAKVHQSINKITIDDCCLILSVDHDADEKISHLLIFLIGRYEIVECYSDKEYSFMLVYRDDAQNLSSEMPSLSSVS